MTLAEAIDAVCDRWISVWGVATPTFFDNEAGTPPTDGTSFSRLSVVALPDLTATLGAIGSRRVTRRGLVILQINAALDAGLAAAAALVATARSVFERASVADLHYEDAVVRQGRSDGRWWSTRIDVAFHYTELV